MRVERHEERIAEWLEDGVQSVPDWLLESALQEAHALPQLRPLPRLPGTTLGRRPAPQQAIFLAAGALGALAVVAAFALGLLASRQPADLQPSPSSTISPSPSTSISTTPRLTALGGVEPIHVLPPDAGPFYTLIGLAAGGGSVWSVAVVERDGPNTAVNILLRIDAASGEASEVPLPGSAGLLSPPAADEKSVWTASSAGLHRVDMETLAVVTMPLGFEAREISIGEGGLWIAHAGGTSLVDPSSGEVLRQVVSPTEGRIIGAPTFDSLWACSGNNVVARIDPTSGGTLATIALPADSGGPCRNPAYPYSGVAGLPDGVVPGGTRVSIDPLTNSSAGRFNVSVRWRDLIVLDGRLWFVLTAVGDARQIGLAPVDVATRSAAQVLTLDGRFHLNATFDSESVVETGGYLWLLAYLGTDDPRPQLLRVPLQELASQAD